MKSIVLSLLLTISIFSFSRAQNVGIPKVYFDINPDNCLSCMNTLHNVSIFEKANQDYYFVFQKKYQTEKEFILKKYRLTSLKARYIWSDSLYEALHVGLGSSVSLLSTTSRKRIEIPMVNFDSGTAVYFMKHCKPIDTIRYDKDVLSPLISQIEVSGDLLYSMKSLKKDTIDILNVFTGNKQYIALTDSISKLNFQHNFNSLDKWRQAAYIHLPDNNEFVNFIINGDTLLAISRHNYILGVHGDDTGIASFYSMNLFKNGRFLQSYKINPMALYPDYFWSPDFTYWKGLYFFTLIKASINNKKNFYFCGEYKPKGDELKFDKYYPGQLADSTILNSRFGIHTIFQKNKFFIFLGNRLYTLGDTLSIKVPFLENKFTNTTIKKYNRMLPQFRFNDKYVWFNYYPQNSDSLISIKFALSNSKSIDTKTIKSSFLFPFYDDFDYNFIYIPLDSHTIVRKFLN